MDNTISSGENTNTGIVWFKPEEVEAEAKNQHRQLPAVTQVPPQSVIVDDYDDMTSSCSAKMNVMRTDHHDLALGLAAGSSTDSGNSSESLDSNPSPSSVKLVNLLDDDDDDQGLTNSTPQNPQQSSTMTMDKPDDEFCSPSNVQLELEPLPKHARTSRLPSSASSTTEINSILENFNEILDNAVADAELEYEIQDLQLCDENTRDFIVKSMENLSDLLLGEEYSKSLGECDKKLDIDNECKDELLIIVETESSEEESTDNNTNTTDSTPTSIVLTNASCLLSPDPYISVGSEEPDEEDEVDPEEGYESDRPMMGRPSMRRLRPIQMLPMIPASVVPSNFIPTEIRCPPKVKLSTTTDVSNNNTSFTSNESALPATGLATTLNSPATNMILVTSLINNVLESPANLGTGNASYPGGNGRVGNEGQEQSDGNTHQRQSSRNRDLQDVIVTVTTNDPSQSQSSTAENMNDILEPPPPSYSVTVTNSAMGNGSSSSSSINSASTTTSCSGNSTLEALGCESSSSQATMAAARTVVARHANRTITIPPDAEAGNNAANSNNNGNNTSRRIRRTTSSASNTSTSNGRWPHRLSSVLALLGCTLGLNNICRFSLLSVEYGANFTVQFFLLSCVIGIPLFTFHMSIGQYLNSGIIDMWKISPIFQGIGVGLLLSQAMIGIYTAVGVSWMFIYFRDSFITRFDQYRWGKCFHDYRGCDPFSNATLSLAETVPDYFNGVVLQRSTPDYPSSNYFPTSLKFTVAFNLAVVWMLIFVSLSKGLKSYGKVIHGFILIPIVAVLILASKMVGIVPTDDTSSLFGQTEWTNFFFNSETWILAAREAFFTWGVLGACIMQITSHNKYEHSLKSDASIVILITTFVLFLSAFIGNACYSILISQDYIYVPSSFESIKTYTFLVRKPPELPNMPILPSYLNQHTSFLMGVKIQKPDGHMSGHQDRPTFLNSENSASGYQALRIATELYPATMAILGSQGISPFWTVLFYFTAILFGIAQQLAIWHSLIKGVIAIKAKTLKSWETTITFFVCLIGFGLGLPLCTELGIFITYFLDYCIGSGWWIMVLYLLELVAVFVVRGAPYCGENIITVLMTGNGQLTKCFAPLLSFVWNVILPVAMLVLSIASFKSGNVRELYDWNYSADMFWPSWTRELGSFIQLIPLLMVPFVAIIQSCRYLTNGSSDLFDRLQQLYRPQSRGIAGSNLLGALGRNRSSTGNGGNSIESRVAEDAPPKYTPPPSYSTATSARIAKFLRASLRRSLRRISNPGSSTENLPPPPNYASVILEINNAQQNPCCSSTLAAGNQPSSSQMTNASDNLLPILLPLTSALSSSSVTSACLQPLVLAEPAQTSCTASITNEKLGDVKPDKSTSVNFATNEIPANHNLEVSHQFERSNLRRIASDITPNDVARILRATFQKDVSNTKTDTETTANLNLGPTLMDHNSANLGESVNIPYCNRFSDRHTSIESDQFRPLSNSDNNTFLLTHCRTSSFPRSNFYNNFMDFSRCSRRSNDSQIALILDPSRRESLASDILSNEEFLSCRSTQESEDGIVNPTFQLNSNDDGNLLSSSATKTTMDIAGTSPCPHTTTTRRDSCSLDLGQSSNNL